MSKIERNPGSISIQAVFIFQFRQKKTDSLYARPWISGPMQCKDTHGASPIRDSRIEGGRVVRILGLRLLARIVPFLMLTPGAHAVVIDFENLQPVTVISQYSNLGVSFNGPRLFDYSQGSAIAHSGGKAIELCFSVEFCSAPLVVRFTEGQPRVKLWVGYSSQLSMGNTVILEGFDESDSLVAQASAVLSPSPGPIAVQVPLEVISGSPNIRRVVLSFAAGPNGPAYNNGLVIDDIEFDIVGGPPSCSATSAPVIALTQPAMNAEVSVNQFQLQGNVSSSGPLEEARLMVKGLSLNPAPVQLTDLLGGSIVSPTGGSFGAINIGDSLYPGVNLVEVKARNCFGSNNAIRLVKYTALESDTKFKVLGMEVVQATQDLRNSVPLVSNKSTIVRVYLALEGPMTAIGSVTGSLTATPPGGFAIPPVLHSSNAITVTSSQDVQAQRLDITRSLNFVLPMEWTADRTLHFETAKLQIQGVEVEVPCDGCRNLDEINAPRWAHFNPTRPMNLVIAPYVYAHSDELTPDILFTPMGALQWLNNVYPLAGKFPMDDLGIRIVRILPMNATARDLSFNSEGGGDFLDDLEDMRSALQVYYDGVWPSDFHLLAVVPCGCGGRARSSVRVAYVDTYNLEAGNVVPQARFETYGQYWAHEIGHNLGRDHLGNDHGESNNGDSDVDSGSSIPHGGIGEPGLAINTDQWFGRPFVVPPGDLVGCGKHAHDFMSYGHGSCQHRYSWVSPYTYKALFSHYLQTAQAAAPAPQGNSEHVTVAGRIKVDGTVILRPFFRRAMRAGAGSGTTGDYAMELWDESGGVLHSYRFNPGKTEGTSDLSFHEVVPWKTGTRQIVLKKGSRILAKREVSANNPWVRIPTAAGSKGWDAKNTVRWEAGDKDGDRLTFNVLYSAAGEAWLPVAVGLKEPSATIDTRLLPGSRQARFRVEVTDGVNTSHADSGPFVVAGKPPMVEIFMPRDRVIAANLPVEFVGLSYDAEDGMLPNASLNWESDRQGRLGQGRRLQVKSLSPGIHVITLTATDREGGSASARVTLTVGNEHEIRLSPVGVSQEAGN